MKNSLRQPLINFSVILLVAGLLSGCGRKENAPSPAAPSASGVAVEAVSAAPANPLFEKVRGRWLRPDGGYILEIRSMEAGGKMDAAYFNPKPIHVAKAEASSDGGAIKLFIELRDVNYPGSTYQLTYDAGSDSLKGFYFHAVLRQTFDIFFTRLKP